MRIDFIYILDILISIPKTIYFNFKMLPIRQAVLLPFYVRHGTELTFGGKLELGSSFPLKPFVVKIGNRGSDGISTNGKCCFCLKEGTIKFEGIAAFGKGSSIRVSRSGSLTFGKDFSANRNFFISCSEKIQIGDDVLIGWNVSVRDSDGHTLIVDGQPRPKRKPVIIGNHVWICAHSHILKGSRIGADSVLGYGAIMTSGSEEANVLWAGTPASIVRHNINWNNEEYNNNSEYC